MNKGRSQIDFNSAREIPLKPLVFVIWLGTYHITNC